MVPSPLFVTLTQSQVPLDQLQYIMVALLPDNGKGMQTPLLQEDMEQTGFHFSGKPQRQQQISMDLDLVQPGKYTLIVCTFDPGCTMEFGLSVYSTMKGSVRDLRRLYDE